ncbi:MAG: NUDIX domain-containing protein [bacterium]|nr:NUDIX domain-containing protein [bacterium]
MGAQEQGAAETRGRWLTIPRTLSFILNGDDVLLMKRSPHKRVFPNRYNGVGGHIERDEDPLTSARREIAEETGLIVRDLHLRAVYNVDAGAQTGILLFIFTGETAVRVVTPNHEGTLHWVRRDQLFSLDLVDDLPILLPRILAMQADDAPLFYHVGYDAHDVIAMRLADEG